MTLDALKSLSPLQQEAVEAISRRGRLFLVGGSVRDAIIFGGQSEGDFDFVVEGLTLKELRAILSLFGKGEIVGQFFPVLKFRPKGKRDVFYDFATPSKRNIRGEFIPVETIEEDLFHRDITINAIAYNLSTKALLDPTGGVRDIERRVIRATSPESFSDDPVRTMRALRFEAQLDFSVEEETEGLIRKSASLIKLVSAERVRDELERILMRVQKPSKVFDRMHETGVLEQILPELERCYGVTQPGCFHEYDVFYHSIKTVDFTPRDLVVRLAALLHDVGKPKARVIREDGKACFYGHDLLSEKMSRDILKRLRFSNRTIDDVSVLVRNHMFNYRFSDRGLRRFLRRVGYERIDWLFALREADILSRGRAYPKMDEELVEFSNFKKRAKDIIESAPEFTVRELAVNGHDIMNRFQIPEGPDVGKVLCHLFSLVIDGKMPNERDVLLSEAERFVRKMKKERV
ncbi:HD domain-containing protein [bacterium]|nr:HD domain-containing protein [bacterium]